MFWRRLIVHVFHIPISLKKITVASFIEGVKFVVNSSSRFSSKETASAVLPVVDRPTSQVFYRVEVPFPLKTDFFLNMVIMFYVIWSICTYFKFLNPWLFYLCAHGTDFQF